ncbi:MAG: flagellar hook-associated protein FlgK [Armatimonadetes bacterium]|nr:flagellar hook-associated protein FlgK [Armatimonadota bacterium]
MPLDILRIVKTSMAAQRAALEVVSQNIANASTPCYTRQRPEMVPLAASRIFSPTRSGQGVLLSYVQRLWDARLAANIDYQYGLQQNAEALTYRLEEIEGFIGSLDQGLHTLTAEMFNAWSDLGVDGANMGARRAVIGAAQAFSDSLREIVSRLRQMQAEQEARLSEAVQQANALLQRIADLNTQVQGNQGTLGGNTAAVQRDQTLQELAKLVGATFLHNDDGTVSVLIGGLQVVHGHSIVPLKLVPDPNDPTVHHVDICGYQDPDALSGSLRAALQLRDYYIPQYLSRLDAFARAVADAVNAQHQAGYDLDGNPGISFFTYDPSSPAGTIRVADDIVDDARLVAASAISSPSSDGQNAFRIASIRYDRLFSSLTAEQYVADLVAQIGGDAAAARQAAITRQNLVDSLEARYQERFGVSVDEEAVELMKYQKAFIASARIASVINEMMDDLLSLVH